MYNALTFPDSAIGRVRDTKFSNSIAVPEGLGDCF